jgi:hypothetical protein
MLNSIEPPWYATRMPGGVTGKVREGLPMSIFNKESKVLVILFYQRSLPHKISTYNKYDGFS